MMAFAKKWRNPSATKTYLAWRGMRHRCINPKSAAWANYGGRGITVCETWKDSYDAFFADMGECPEGLSLDRIDVNKGYSPENCRWAGWDVQANNKRDNVHLTHNGETMTASQWAKHLGIKRDTLFRRLNVYKMDVARALTPGSLVPVRKCGTRQGYAKGCRCAECRAVNAKRAKDRKHRIKHLALAGEMASSGSPSTG